LPAVCRDLGALPTPMPLTTRRGLVHARWYKQK
jgi:hypothetical protein